MIDGTASMTQAGIVANGRRDVSLRASDGVAKPKSARQSGRDRRRIGTAGSVGVPRRDTGGGELRPLIAIVEDVERVAFAVAALDQHGARTHLAEAFGGEMRV